MAHELKWGGLTQRQRCLVAMAAITLGFVLRPFGPSHSVNADEPASAQSQAVQLTIDYGDGVQKVFHPLGWKEGLTVLAALESASKHPRGIKLTVRGSGATAFVTAIDDQTNEGMGRNWTYQVNGKRANKSCGAWVLKAGDSVLWRFAEDND